MPNADTWRFRKARRGLGRIWAPPCAFLITLFTPVADAVAVGPIAREIERRRWKGAASFEQVETNHEVGSAGQAARELAAALKALAAKSQRQEPVSKVRPLWMDAKHAPTQGAAHPDPRIRPSTPAFRKFGWRQSAAADEGNVGSYAVASARQSSMQNATVPLLQWAGKRARRLGLEQVHCNSHASCGTNEYCMDCQKCMEFHASMDKDDWGGWSCDPCVFDGGHCESLRYCEIAKDSIDGSCPEAPDCTSHDDCPEDEYCFSCEKCQDWSATANPSLLWKCQPCKGKVGSHCAMNAWCDAKQDAIDGDCPDHVGCGSHSDCDASQYCESCDKCEEYRKTLPEAKQRLWSCSPCPASKGGICESSRFCQIANDGIDGTCPQEHGCSGHAQCEPDEYCFDCTKCAEFRDSLPVEHRGTYGCAPCPTQRNGACGLRLFCEKSGDTVDGGNCPAAHGCAGHSDCKDSEFCMSWDQCEREIGATVCGDRPINGGFCISSQLCTGGRSIDKICPALAVCNSHVHCPLGLFCTTYEDCMSRRPDSCGPRRVHWDGVCLPLEHCVRGLHAPIDGSCPAGASATSRLEVHEVLHFKGTLQLATHHQAMNVWPDPSDSSEMVLAQLHDYADKSTVKDDKEFVGIYKTGKGGILKQDSLVPLSCPSLDVSIPGKPPYFFEARIHLSEFEMSVSHSECSCVPHRRMPGKCPRGLAFSNLTHDFTCEQILVKENIDGNRSMTVLPPAQVAELRRCPGPIEASTDLTFHIDHTSGSPLTSTIRYLDPATGQQHKVLIPHGHATEDVTLRFNGTHLRCETTGRAQACHKLGVGRDVPVILVQIKSFTSISSGSGHKYCAACMPTMSRLHPVIFYGTSGAALGNKLTLYTLPEDFSAPAVLVDSSLAGGEGPGHQGCPRLADPAGKSVTTLEGLRDHMKVLPPGHVTDKWCVVLTGGCPIADKYRLCILGGAKAVLILLDSKKASIADDMVDATAEISLDAKESLDQMVPIVFADVQEDVSVKELLDQLQKGRSPTMFAGPNVGGEASVGHAQHHGGIRAYDTRTKRWVNDNVIAEYEDLGTGGCATPYEDTPLFMAENWITTSQECKDLCNSRRTCGAYAYCDNSKTNCSASCLIYSELDEYTHVSHQSGLRCYAKKDATNLVDDKNFTTFRWTQHSRVRDVLFVCTADGRIVALDSSEPSLQSLPLLGVLEDPLPGPCNDAPLLRDYHVADMKTEGKFTTVVIDAASGGNLLHFYDTTDLKSWRHMSLLHANWEHNQRGLGQVVPSPDGTKLLATWHCSTLYCESTSLGTPEGRGERLYILDLADVQSGRTPSVAATVNLPMTDGSMVRDVGCNEFGICLASLTWDGVVAVDLNPGAHQHRVVAEHSPKFRGDAVPDSIAFARLATGAQKVYPSRVTKNRFYVERWTLDSERFAAGVPLGECLRFDSVWAVTLEKYAPLREPIADNSIEAAVKAFITIRKPYDEVLRAMPYHEIGRFKNIVALALQDALRVTADRIDVPEVEAWDEKRAVRVTVVILPGVGLSPRTLFGMLELQWTTAASAIHSGPFAEYVAVSTLSEHSFAVGDGPWGPNPREETAAQPKPRSEDEAPHSSIGMPFIVVACISLVIAVWAVAICWRYRQAAINAAKAAENARLQVRELQQQASPQQQTVLFANNMAVGNVGAAAGPGFVIGRPQDAAAGGSISGFTGASAGGAAASAPASSSTPYVVGTPVTPGSSAAAAAGGGAVAGAALSQIDQQKLADSGSAASASVPSAAAATAPAASAPYAASASPGVSNPVATHAEYNAPVAHPAPYGGYYSDVDVEEDEEDFERRAS